MWFALGGSPLQGQLTLAAELPAFPKCLEIQHVREERGTALAWVEPTRKVLLRISAAPWRRLLLEAPSTGLQKNLSCLRTFRCATGWPSQTAPCKSESVLDHHKLSRLIFMAYSRRQFRVEQRNTRNGTKSAQSRSSSSWLKGSLTLGLLSRPAVQCAPRPQVEAQSSARQNSSGARFGRVLIRGWQRSAPQAALLTFAIAVCLHWPKAQWKEKSIACLILVLVANCRTNTQAF